VSVTVHVPSQAGGPALEARPARLGGLFPPAVPAPVTPARLAVAVFAVAAGTLVSLSRTTGTGALQSIWEEDARDIFDGALNTPGWGAVGRPVAGYFVIGPRLIGEFATLFPISWAAAVLSVSAALVTALLALMVYCASAPFFPGRILGRLARLAVSVPILVAPVAENRFAEVYNRPVGLHFFAAYALFWVLLWTPERTRSRVAALAMVGLTAVSTILVVAFLPLVGLRLAVRRDRWSLALAGLVAGGSLLQGLGLWTGYATRATSTLHLDAYWVLRTLTGWGLPTSILGFRATSGMNGLPLGAGVAQNGLVVALAWLVVLAVIVMAFIGARRGWLQPQWTLAVAAGVGGLWLYAFTAVASGAIAYRYLVPVGLLYTAAAVALLRPAGRGPGRHPARGTRWRGAALGLLVVGIVGAAATNYRWADTYRSHAPLWTDQVRLATATCRAHPQLDDVVVRGAPRPWWSVVRLPCRDLHPLPFACVQPHCAWLDPPVSTGPPRGRYLR
jgi:hypothetical protein